jgi:iron complex transport system substrate-binding protein
MRKAFACLLLTTFGLWSQAKAADVPCVLDDLNQPVCVKQAQRVLVLAPHLTEIVDFVGGLKQVVAVDGSSNYPVAVNTLPKMGNPWMLGAEAILARKPDLVLVWQSGISMDAVAQLRKAGVAVFVSEPKSIAQVAGTMQRLASLLGTAESTQPKLEEWLKAFDALRAQYAKAQPVSVFYQVWSQPLMTLGGQHVVSEVIALCGGRNVFADLPSLAAQVSVEGVLKRNPSVILASGSAQDNRALVKQWSAWPGLAAVQRSGIHTIPGDILVRNGPRLIDASKQVCTRLEALRR